MPLTPENLPGSAVLGLETPTKGVDDVIVLVRSATRVGRHPENHIALPEKTVSRFHARIERRGDQYYVTDLGSSNGTFLNGARIDTTLLSNADTVGFGDLEFTFYVDEETTGGRLAESDTDVRMRQVPGSSRQEVLHTQAVEDAGRSLEEISDVESVVLAANYLRAHYSFIKIMRQRPSEQRLLSAFLEMLLNVVKAQRGAILLADKKGEEMRTVIERYADDRRLDDDAGIPKAILDRCVQDRVAVLTSDASTDERFASSESVMDLRVRSAICSPLAPRSRILGVCYLDTQSGVDVFSKSDLNFVTHLCSELALALDNIRMTRERVQAERLVIIGRTMSEISHSIKNILSVTQCGAEVIDRSLEKEDFKEMKKTWDVVRNGMGRMHDLVKDMLNYSRTEAHTRSTVDVGEVAEEVYNALKAEMLEAGIELVFECAEKLPLCLIDPTGLHEALINLAVNARDAVAVVDDPRIVIKTQATAGNRVIVSVSDNGLGVPEDMVERIFNPFFTTKGAEGNGMGLAMVKKYAREMEGT